MTPLRGIAAAACGLAILISAAPASAAGTSPRPASQALNLTALSFARSSADASNGTAHVKLTWTITDSASAATAITGDVFLAVPGTTPGTVASATVKIPFSLAGGHGVTVTGTAADSVYLYTFHVPQYAQVSPAAWQITQLTIADNAGNTADLTGTALSGFHAVLTATEVVDTSAPTYQNLAVYSPTPGTPRPYLYVSRTAGGYVAYSFDVTDYPAGLASGSITVTGPGGHTASAGFVYQRASGTCGEISSGGGPNQPTCQIPVRFPEGSPAGSWVVSSLTLTDAAGNTATSSGLNTAPVTLTSDSALKASHFKATPNPVDNWTADVTTQVSMTVTGASGGISAVYVDADSCQATTSVPAVTGTTVSIPVRVYSGVQTCQVEGIAVIDGAGDVALYGQEYRPAPDPYLLIRQVRDTTPPTATSASLSQTSIPSSQFSNQQVSLTVGVLAPTAPVDGLNIYVYDSSGQEVYESGGGAGPGNPVSGSLPFPYFPPPGVYTIGFTIIDAGGLSTSYGPGANPVPGGPLTLTVTSG